MINRWLPVGLSAVLVPVLISTSVGAVSPAGSEQQEQNYTLPGGAELPPQLLAAQRQERRVALVIGNGDYSRNGWLRNPPNDAKDIAKVLEQLGFEVTLKLDLNQEQMEEEVERFNHNLQQGSVGLFYYAGHAVQTGGENYLIPIGAKINREQDMRYKTVPLGQILGAMEEAGNRLNIVILDACRDNPSLRRFTKSIARGLAPIQREPEGMLIAYATAPGDVTQDGEGRNSPYTASLLEHIVEPGVPLPLLFANVRQSVRQKTRGKQSPRYVSSVDGSFSFKAAVSTSKASVSTTLAPSDTSKLPVKLERIQDKTQISSGASQYKCKIIEGIPFTVYEANNDSSFAFIAWKSNSYFDDSNYTPQNRCKEVSKRWESNRRLGNLRYLVAGEIAGYSALCASKESRREIMPCTDENLLMILRPSDDVHEIIKRLVEFNTAVSVGILEL